MKREWAVKQLTRREKLELIAGWQQPCEKGYTQNGKSKI